MNVVEPKSLDTSVSGTLRSAAEMHSPVFFEGAVFAKGHCGLAQQSALVKYSVGKGT